MFRLRIFRKHFLILAAVILIFCAIGVCMNLLIAQIGMETRTSPGPALFFAKLIDDLSPHDRVAGLAKIEGAQQGEMPFSLSIIAPNGSVLYPRGSQPDLNWNEVHKPKEAYQVEKLKSDLPQAPPGMPPLEVLIRFKGEPEQYLLVRMKLPHDGAPPFKYFILSIALLILSVLVGIGIALGLLYRSLATKVALADSVISELKKGNLKARFPISKMDDFGLAMIRFNQMAEEIEHLVERLKFTERSRMILLQDLAHDLRTPITAIKGIAETFYRKGDSLSPEVKKELSLLTLKEISYFEKLVEDLLVLAQVSEPRYQQNKSIFNLSELILDEAESIESMYESAHKILKLKTNINPENIDLLGDEMLIRRMMRNVIDNAFSFAKNVVIIDTRIENGKIFISVTDDGSGFSVDALEAYGVRRISRSLGSGEGARLSVGLGSVIVKTIAEAHRGRVWVQNKLDSSRNVIGATVIISLPIEVSSAT